MVFKKLKTKTEYEVWQRGKKKRNIFTSLSAAKKFAESQSKKTSDRIYIDKIDSLGYF